MNLNDPDDYRGLLDFEWVEVYYREAGLRHAMDLMKSLQKHASEKRDLDPMHDVLAESGRFFTSMQRVIITEWIAAMERRFEEGA